MGFDFELILLVILAVTGITILADKLFWAAKRTAVQKPLWPIEWSHSLFYLLFIVIILRSFVFEPFRIPSGSLEPTLRVGDFLLVSKSSYGIRLPLTHTKIFNIGEPKHGDIVVFRWPANTKYNF